MKIPLIIIFIFLTVKSYGQCDGEYIRGFYHNSMFINSEGDTLNKSDSLGFYEGFHLYTDDKNNLYNDTISYTLGQYHHGFPIGNWKDHCGNGSFSIGEFNQGIEASTNDSGEWVTRKQGCYAKIGIWKYYDKDSNLIKTIRYDRSFKRNTWIDKKYLLSTSGDFKLIHYYFNCRRKAFYKRMEKSFTNDGVLILSNYYSFWKSISYEYYENGEIRKIEKRRKLIGKELNTIIVKEYNYKGQLECKIKTKRKNRKHDSIWSNVEW